MYEGEWFDDMIEGARHCPPFRKSFCCIVCAQLRDILIIVWAAYQRCAVSMAVQGYLQAKPQHSC